MTDGDENSVESLPIRDGPPIAEHTPHPPVPQLFTVQPPIKDRRVTLTSEQQDEVVEACLPFLCGIADPDKSIFDFSADGVPRLERVDHVEFLKDSLDNARFMAYDASRPWMLYWSLTGLSLLDQDVTVYRERLIQTLRPAQNESGGFGGGHGQLSHLAPSYAAILSLVTVGGSDALEMIDRKAMWLWLGSVKQSGGGFCMSVGGEEDVRGAYCAMVMISLLGLPLELPQDAPSRRAGLGKFTDGLPEYLSRCQSFEGGISARPHAEAHGGYAFLALATLCILGPPEQMIPRYLNLSLLISWLSARHYAPEGGLSGRTNKLVDACYSQWVGGGWPLVEAAMGRICAPGEQQSISLYSSDGLIRYILCCCQAENGGLRDKPSRFPDAYHTCYALAGLSHTQHRARFMASDGKPHDGLDAARQWEWVGRRSDDPIYDADDTVRSLHPIYVLPWRAVEYADEYFASRNWS